MRKFTKFITEFFTKNIGIKILSAVIAVLCVILLNI